MDQRVQVDRRTTSLVFGLAIFFGAFLLFQVQPLIGKFILPWFGGTPSVWTVCMLFFQVLLLGGYAYAHFTTSYLRPRAQVIVHVGLLVLSLAFLPIIPRDAIKPDSPNQPIISILSLLALTVGVPYLALSATSPLIQAWHARAAGAPSYRLYALSNVGSLLALLSYPFLFEPVFTRQSQARIWSFGMAAFAIVCAICGWLFSRRSASMSSPSTQVVKGTTAMAPSSALHEQPVLQYADPGTDVAKIFAPSEAPRLLWVLLPAVASVLLLAVTNTLSQDVAVVPFLWVLPLALYLITFIIAFDHPRWYQRWIWLPLTLMALSAIMGIFFWDYLRETEWWPISTTIPPLWLEIGLYCAILFCTCMVCHGEVARLKPIVRSGITLYFLALSVGGALGGVLVGVVAPLVFDRFYELQIGIACFLVLALTCLYFDPQHPLHRGKAFPIWVLIIILTFLYCWVLMIRATYRLGGTDIVERVRNFYGVLTVYDYQDGDNDESKRRMLQHGHITHGLQWLAPEHLGAKTTYYSPDSGAGLALEKLHRPGGRRVALVGLGAGTLAAYGQPGDTFRFYEINPEVVRIAKQHFSFIANSQATVEVTLGDARLSMERELQSGSQNYDVILLDAFSGDAIPVHLITREAIDLYLRHLKPDGVIAVHISNQYLDLEPVLFRAVEYAKLNAVLVRSPEDTSWAYYSADWVLMGRDADQLARLNLPRLTTSTLIEWPEVKLWTDDYSSLYQTLRER